MWSSRFLTTDSKKVSPNPPEYRLTQLAAGCWNKYNDLFFSITKIKMSDLILWMSSSDISVGQGMHMRAEALYVHV